jgi:hypothetical protein
MLLEMKSYDVEGGIFEEGKPYSWGVYDVFGLEL